MTDLLGSLRRTHTCGALRPSDVDTHVVLLGWVHRVRDLGALLFLDIRDRYGLTQVVVRGNAALVEKAKQVKTEFVVAVVGVVERRSDDTINPKLDTGEVEVLARELLVLNDAERPPFQIADEGPVAEETRLRYRYLDLRKPRMQRNVVLRHRVSMAIREYFDSQGFIEVETPILTKSTPEGARDYLVPSRVHPGEFFALPQSPQLFKQILMISGLDRYFQIARCFRDEDLRADRQPEFTQVDVEISFATPDLVYSLIEPAIARVLREIGVEVPLPLPRMPYDQAIARYGSDKPDLRFGMAIEDLSQVFAESGFGPFREALDSGGVVRGFVIPGAASYSRREVDELSDLAKQCGGAGVIWVRLTPEGGVQSPVVKAVGDGPLRAAFERAGATKADVLVLAAGQPDATSTMLGQMRLQLAKRANLLKPDQFAFTWVTDFPLFEWDGTEQRYFSVNHPFTAPRDEDLALLDSEPGRVKAKAYNIVLNGMEIGGGSIRIHDQTLQAKVFRLLGMTDEEATHRFGFFLEALRYGTPPHGGIALGLDRITALLSGETSIREVIAFPKTAAAVDLMVDAPSTVDPRQLRELRLKTLG